MRKLLVKLALVIFAVTFIVTPTMTLDRQVAYAIARPDFVVLIIDPWSAEVVETLRTQFWIDTYLPYREIWTNWWNNELVPHFENTLMPLVYELRANRIPIVISPNGYPVASALSLNSREPIINDMATFLAWIRARGITDVYYVGYSTNICVLDRPLGIRAMSSQSGVNLHLVLDATVVCPEYHPNLEETLALCQQLGVEVIDINVLRGCV